MAVYKDPRIIKKVSIPSIPDSEVEMYNTLLWKDAEEVCNADAPFMSRGKEMLVRLIKDWNLTDENGVKLPINIETIDNFTLEVVNYLVSQTEFAPKDKTVKENEETKKK